jgi:HEAT repeat protein
MTGWLYRYCREIRVWAVFRVLIFAVVLCAGFRALAMLSAHDFSDKTVAQLLNLLEDKDRAVRVDAALYLGYRYRKPGIEINPPTYKAQHPEFPLPSQVVPSLSEHLKLDSDYGVRIEAMRALRDLMSCTNSTSILSAGLDDTNAYVRIWTCSALIDIHHDHSQPLSTRVVPTLSESLSVDSSEEPTWLAAWIAGQLGGAGKALLPQLQALRKHESSKVRHYAREAIKSIEHGR